MLYELLTFGSVLFWVALLVPAVFFLIFVFSERSIFWSLFCLGVIFGIVFGLTSGHGLEFPSLEMLLVGASTWLVGGAIYATISWYLTVVHIRSKVAEFDRDSEWDDYNREYRVKGKSMNDVLYYEFYPDNIYRMALPPRPSDFKTRITNWILFWPVLGIFKVIRNPLEFISKSIGRIGRGVYNSLTGLFSKIAEKEFKDYVEKERPSRKDE